MIQDLEAKLLSFLMALLEASRHYAQVLEALLVELLNKEKRNPLMVVLDVKHRFPIDRLELLIRLR